MAPKPKQPIGNQQSTVKQARTPQAQSYQTYLVGGCVRDELLGLPILERDWVVVGATEETLLAQGFKRVGQSFPVFLHPKSKEEYALARTERKTEAGYHGFICDFNPGVTLEEDLQRRDLTINAIAKTEDGRLVDPYDGVTDIKARVLRHVSAAFAEDPVRVLRVGRFMAKLAPLGFTVAPETLSLMQEMVTQGEVDALVPERVWREMHKALVETDPKQSFLTLRACGALSRLFPALDKLWGVPQTAEHHPEIDTGVHTMMVLDQACQLTADPVVRFAALCHDLGKGETPVSLLPKHHGHEKMSARRASEWCQQYRVPNEYRDLAVAVAEYHTHCHKALELKPQTLLSLLQSLSAFRNSDYFEKFLLACTADARGRLGKESEPYPQADYLRKVCKAASDVDVPALMATGLEGAALGKMISVRRLENITLVKKMLK